MSKFIVEFSTKEIVQSTIIEGSGVDWSFRKEVLNYDVSWMVDFDINLQIDEELNRPFEKFLLLVWYKSKYGEQMVSMTVCLVELIHNE